MMPMAMGFLFLELQLLQHLFIEDERHGPGCRRRRLAAQECARCQ